MDISNISEVSLTKEEVEEKKKFDFAKRRSNINSQKNLTIFNDLGKDIKKVKKGKRSSSIS